MGEDPDGVVLLPGGALLATEAVAPGVMGWAVLDPDAGVVSGLADLVDLQTLMDFLQAELDALRAQLAESDEGHREH